MSTGSDPVQGACAHSACDCVENLKVSVLQLPSVFEVGRCNGIAISLSVGHDYVKILKLVLKNQSVPKMA